MQLRTKGGDWGETGTLATNSVAKAQVATAKSLAAKPIQLRSMFQHVSTLIFQIFQVSIYPTAEAMAARIRTNGSGKLCQQFFVLHGFFCPSHNVRSMFRLLAESSLQISVKLYESDS